MGRQESALRKREQTGGNVARADWRLRVRIASAVTGNNAERRRPLRSLSLLHPGRRPTGPSASALRLGRLCYAKPLRKVGARGGRSRVH